MISSRKLSGIFLLSSIVVSAVLAVMLSLRSKGENKAVDGIPVNMKFSSLLSMTECDGYTVADVSNPWGEGILRRYILVPKTGEIPSTLPAGSFAVSGISTTL